MGLIATGVAGRYSHGMGTFELYRDGADLYRFRLKDRKGTIIAVGEGFETELQAVEALTAVRREASTAETVEVEG